jgi:hypothetical protein
MWDYIVGDEIEDSGWREWYGIQFYLSEDKATLLDSANPRMDRRVMRIRSVSEVFDNRIDLEMCAKNRTSHVLQVVWGAFDKSDHIPALEITDYWYACGRAAGVSGEERFSTSHEFCAIAILSVDMDYEQYGLRLPREFIMPFRDRSGEIPDL